MKTDLSRKLKWAMALDGTTIRKLCETVGTAENPVKIWARCKDHATRTFESIDELLAYPNPRDRRILSLHLSNGLSYEGTALALSSYEWETISLEIHDDEANVISKSDTLLTELRGAKTWYSFIHVLDPVLFLLIVWIALLVGVGYLSLMGIVKSMPPNANTPDLPAGFALGFLALITLVAGLIYAFRTKVFPITTFRIGQQEQSYQILEKLRWVVVSAVVLGPLARGFLALV